MSEYWQSAPSTAWSDDRVSSASPPRKRRHGLRNLLIVLVVLAGLLVAADRVGAAVAERIAAQQIQQHEDLSTRPSVDVHGFPFLTQFASGRYSHVTISIGQYTVRNGNVSLAIDDISVDLYDITTSRDFKDLSADRGTAHAVVSYGSLSQALGASVRYAGGGRVSATRSVSVLGVQVDGTVSAAPRATSTGLAFDDIQASVDGASVPQVAISALTQFFQTSVDLSGLPFGIRLTSVAATAQGLEFDLAGTNLSYQS